MPSLSVARYFPLELKATDLTSFSCLLSAMICPVLISITCTLEYLPMARYRPSGLKAMSVTRPKSVKQVTIMPVSISHIHTTSLPDVYDLFAVARYFLSGLKTRDTRRPGFFNVGISLELVVSQTLALPSQLPVAKYFPSGLKEIATTLSS